MEDRVEQELRRQIDNIPESSWEIYDSSTKSRWARFIDWLELLLQDDSK